MKHNTYILTIMLLLMTSIVKAQETFPISKVDVLNRVSKENLSIKISEQEFFQARADYRQTNAVFLPNITASHTGIATTNPLMAFGSKLNQEILNLNDFNPSLLNNPSQIENYATKIEIQQPLINVDGIYQRKAAKSKMEAMSLQTQRTTDYLMFEVDKAYMQLQLAYKGVDVLELALETANENKKLADNSYKQGYLQRADVLSVEVRVTEIKNQLQTAKSNVENASNYLSFLMNTNTNAILKPTDSLTVSNVNLYANESITENRSDIKAMYLALNAYEAMNKADKMAFLPRLNAFGSYELYDDKVFQGDANGYLFGAQLSWNIFEGSKRFGKAQKSKAEFDKSKLEYEQYVSQSNLELNKAKRMLTDAENRLNLTQLALEQSKESLRIRTDRFEEGLEKTSDLLAAETQYAQKQLEYYQTIFEYNYAQAYLQFLTKE
ncbi:TolC family protein [Flavobacteriaceae bacterium S0825]|uniref:TolC family protein n=1 Tax=Gaetbulibacter sp. S0825 TaxID=2720084 RepID=UPI0014319221|nr:TolC family protein [Gaetbulibacter sp. S0825]MCK0109463.1 TolC family protein [Flavobacteriaceae bacterium S0825]NIX65098.1 TolC family protein [Gaetbulibacter sp. S0825]